MLLKRNGPYLNLMRDVFEVSRDMGCKTYLWGGFAIDALSGRLTRVHGDLDCFTEGLLSNRERLRGAYEAKGYAVAWLEEFWMLQISKPDAHAAFNALEVIDGVAHWRHAGAHGTIFFPADWLDAAPRSLCGIEVLTAGPRLLYALKRHPELLSPRWKGRAKDAADLEALARVLRAEGIEESEIYGRVFGHNPIWYAQGYEEYLMPIIPRA